MILHHTPPGGGNGQLVQTFHLHRWWLSPVAKVETSISASRYEMQQQHATTTTTTDNADMTNTAQSVQLA